MVRSTVNGILPYVFSYISNGGCLYNFNYTGRPLRGPGIIGIVQVHYKVKKVEFHNEHSNWDQNP